MGNLSKIVLDDETLEVEDTKARTNIGDITTLKTNAKDTLVKAVNECFQSASDGKAIIASAITGKGVNTDSGATFAVMAENIGSIPVGIDTSDATATAAQILSGATAYGSSGKLTGTMADYSGKNLGYQPSGETYTDDGTQVTRLYLSSYVAIKKASNSLPLIRIKLGTSGAVNENTYVDVPVTNLSEGNIKAGVMVGYPSASIGVTGTFTADGTATAAQILAGKIAYVNGSKVTGTMTDRSGWTWAVSATDNSGNSRIDVVPQAGYYNGSAISAVAYSTIANIIGLTGDKLLSGNTICGVDGTVSIGKKYASGYFTNTDFVNDGSPETVVYVYKYYNGSFQYVTYGMKIISVSGLGFKPSHIMLTYQNRTSTYYATTSTIYREAGFCTSGSTVYNVLFSYTGSSDVSGGLTDVTANTSYSTYVADGSFKLPFVFDNRYSDSVFWEAWE